MDTLVKSLTPLFFLFFAKLCSDNVPYWFRINYLNLCIASLLYHYSIEYDIAPEYKHIFEMYDRFVITYWCSHYILNNTLQNLPFALLIGCLSLFIQYVKQISYLLCCINIITNVNIWCNIILSIILPISWYIFITKNNEIWTTTNKIIWHITQSLYIYLSIFKYK